MFTGVYDLPWWGYVVYALVMTHITIAGVTIYLHRHQAHRALDLHPIAQPFLPLLAVAHDRHGHQGMGRHTSQAPRQMRNGRRSAQPADLRHQQSAVGRRGALSQGIARTRKRSERYGHGTPDDWIERNLYSRFTVLGIALMLVIELRAVRLHRHHDLGRADDLDPVHGRRRHQRHRPLLGLSQLPARRREQEHRAVGHPDRRRRAAQQSPRVRHLGAAFEPLGTSSTSAGCTSACWRCSGLPTSRKSRRG